MNKDTCISYALGEFSRRFFYAVNLNFNIESFVLCFQYKSRHWSNKDGEK